ncbi:MAG: PEP-CTERM sorting domain-containing protein [Phycisphaera sp.]|nr:PEP-CTERM sorting domain-containing protein [Phycisphaera sp.]
MMKVSLIIVSTVVGIAAVSANAAVLFTDFDNTGVSGGDMVGVVWTENGLSAPTTLGASASVRSGLTGDGDVEGGYFSPNANVNGSSEGSPAWTATWTITVGAGNVELTDIVLRSAESNSGALLGGGNGGSNIKLTIKDNTTTNEIANQTQARSDQSGVSQSLTYTLPLTLTAGNTYDVTFAVWELGTTSSGHYESMDSLEFNGSVTPVPEPATLALLGIGGLMLIPRKRHAKA